MTFDNGTIDQLFATEADQDPKFAQETSVLLRSGETQETLRSGLTSKNWVILSGDKGSGKTSYLFFGLKNLAPKLLGIYAPFETPESNFKITCREERDEFLCKHFYAGLISRLDKIIREKLQDKEKKSQIFLRRMIDALVPVEVERTTTRKNERSFLVKLGIRKQPVEFGASYGKSIQDEIIERRKEPARPDYAKFRQILVDLIRELGFEAAVFYVDEVNEIRLDPTEVSCLFEHIYDMYKTYKPTVCFKMAITDAMEEAISDPIVSGNYFEIKNLKSALLYPKEYEDFIREILQKRMNQLRIGVGLEEIFSQSALHILVMASMGNPRDFFLAAKEVWNTSSRNKIDQSLAMKRVKIIGGEREKKILGIGGYFRDTYEELVGALRERSTAKEGDSSSPTGVSYFMIAEADKLLADAREALAKLEREKIIYSTSEYRALRRKGQKSEMMVISYPICILRSIRYLDIVKTMEKSGYTENQIISRHRAQILLKNLKESSS